MAPAVHGVSSNAILIKHSFKAIIMHGTVCLVCFSLVSFFLPGRVNYVPVVRAWKWISSAFKISTDMIISSGKS
jgi:hypothetical protein